MAACRHSVVCNCTHCSCRDRLRCARTCLECCSVRVDLRPSRPPRLLLCHLLHLYTPRRLLSLSRPYHRNHQPCLHGRRPSILRYRYTYMQHIIPVLQCQLFVPNELLNSLIIIHDSKGPREVSLCGCAQYVNLWGTMVGYTITASTSMM